MIESNSMGRSEHETLIVLHGIFDAYRRIYNMLLTCKLLYVQLCSSRQLSKQDNSNNWRNYRAKFAYPSNCGPYDLIILVTIPKFVSYPVGVIDPRFGINSM